MFINDKYLNTYIMELKKFQNIYYVSNEENTELRSKLIYYDDVGELLVGEETIQFTGKKKNIIIPYNKIDDISIHKSELSLFHSIPGFLSLILIFIFIIINFNLFIAILFVFFILILMYFFYGYLSPFWVKVNYFNDFNNNLEEIFITPSSLAGTMIGGSSKAKELSNLLSNQQKQDFEKFKSDIYS